VFSPLIFVIVLEAFSRSDDLVLMAEMVNLLAEKIQGLRVNVGKTKIMKCQASFGRTENL